MNKETTLITINFNPLTMQLLKDSQKKYEQLFETKISYEDVIIKSLFFTNQTNMIKLAILNSYELDKTSITHEIADKNITDHTPPKPVNLSNNPKSMKQKKPQQQATLRGF